MRSIVRVVTRIARMLLIAVIVGLGGSMGSLGGGFRKAEKPEPDNPIVFVVEESSERE